MFKAFLLVQRQKEKSVVLLFIVLGCVDVLDVMPFLLIIH